MERGLGLKETDQWKQRSHWDIEAFLTSSTAKIRGAKWLLFLFGEMQEFITLDTEHLTDTHSYARERYKDAIGDRDKDYWEGYLDALDAVYQAQKTR